MPIGRRKLGRIVGPPRRKPEAIIHSSRQNHLLLMVTFWSPNRGKPRLVRTMTGSNPALSANRLFAEKLSNTHGGRPPLLAATRQRPKIFTRRLAARPQTGRAKVAGLQNSNSVK